jgi:hypothetical protein
MSTNTIGYRSLKDKDKKMLIEIFKIKPVVPPLNIFNNPERELT